MSEVAAKVDNLGWTERFNNLKKRFPGVKDEEILKALELHKGHAGKAADDIQKTTVKYQLFGPDHGHGRSFWFCCD
eukprot:CAMPEP_0119512826 /NCGR_PEP_ID=MMETSP1344-20130328/31106_1 /TAXON_ID=236787 /ORGANISM="Florenciella parvula, Strain CCMP2471" /LENGTH=75 /DNA_ID=CAMNT_0007549987 /DNA_START=147 /DNA_END=374 /DNA_ORIENTATION=+